MKFFCVSDIHSHYSALKKALDEAGFEKDNPTHYLISCGDALDRGDESEEVLHFLMSLERKILVKGNHDLLLEDLCSRGFPYSHDKSNGTFKTVQDLGNTKLHSEFHKACENTWNKTAAYRDCLVDYFETENYIFCHSWVPLKCLDDLPKHYIRNRQFEYEPDWRNADKNSWEQAMWGNPFELAAQGLNKTSKWLVCGHWHCSAGWAKKEGLSEFGEDAKWNIYKDEKNKVIFIDKCTVYTKQINVLVLEDNFLNKEGN